MASLCRTLLVAALALLIRVSEAQFPIGMGMGFGLGPGLGMGMGMGMGLGMGLGVMGPHYSSFFFDDDDDDDDYDDDNDYGTLRLTCNHNVTNRLDVVTDHMTATFKEVVHEDYDFDNGYNGYGYGYGSGYGSGYGRGYGHGGYYGNGYGYPRKKRSYHIKAEIQIKTSHRGHGSLVLTRMARVENGCSTDTLGAILSTFEDDDFDDDFFDDDDDDDFNGFNGFGGIGGFGGLGYGGLGGLSGGFGFGHHGHHHYYDDDDDDDDDRDNYGVLKNDIFLNKNTQTIYIDELKGFTRLRQLAGRGLAICADASFDFDWHSSCAGPYYGCCTLKYDDDDADIDNGYHNGNGHGY
ncbi:hypothetical protein PoB_002385000 [Plakobranchus ocellatus]|uniref:Uncharacterized protein n=1 Tax=Plakobranchus ocellatus TaxID=259542 RepID=A0AAV3ZRW8_9GAST|nr:hypothetical protein PoB_002385000 [Plakobranchus ocellatus]